MVQKYTIWKLLIRNLNKESRSVKGFTLLELVFGMLITIIVGGLALNAFIEASNSFNKDKKNIDSNQKLSAVLELIGNDVRQAGEQINDARFPAVEIEPNTDALSMPLSSKITIRRSLSIALNLCESITPTSANTALVVADNALVLPGCNIGTPSTIVPVRPNTLRQARDKRCQLDESSNIPDIDYCQGSVNDDESVLAVISDGLGNIRPFIYKDDNPDGATKYKIAIDTFQPSKPDSAATYASGTTPIYLIEESIYTLKNDGSLQVARKGGTARTLVKGITAFNVDARVYADKATKAPEPSPVARRCVKAEPAYTCRFNARLATEPPDDWKTLQGVRVRIQAKYDPTGRSTTPSTDELTKLTATAEFFPRNVLSR